MKSHVVFGIVVGVATGLFVPAFAHAADSSSASAPAAAAAIAPARPAFILKPAKGFIDDPFVLNPEADELAILRTDSASFARIEVIDLKTEKVKQVFELGDPHPVFERVLFAGKSGGVVVIIRGAKDGRRVAQYFGADGKPAGLVGPVTDFGTAWRSQKPHLIGWDQTKNFAGDTIYTVSEHDLDGLVRVGKPKTYVATKTGELKKPPLKIIAWQNGYSQIIGTRTIGYDTKKDIRQPDRGALFDALAGVFTWESDIGDVYGWAFASEMRRKRPNRAFFPLIADDASSFEVVDAQAKRAPVKLPNPLDLYEARSLQDQEDPRMGVLYVSLAVDPLNPKALARQKADKAYLDIFTLNVGGASATAKQLLRTPLDDRPVGWAASPGTIALLRKFKSFSRGGSEIEVYRLR